MPCPSTCRRPPIVMTILVGIGTLGLWQRRLPAAVGGPRWLLQASAFEIALDFRFFSDESCFKSGTDILPERAASKFEVLVAVTECAEFEPFDG